MIVKQIGIRLVDQKSLKSSLIVRYEALGDIFLVRDGFHPIFFLLQNLELLNVSKNINLMIIQ